MSPAASLHPAAPASVPHGSFTLWIVAAVVLALVVTAGVAVGSRR